LRKKYCELNIANRNNPGSSIFQVGKAMKTTTQAWTWLTAGVLALGLNGIYQDGGATWAHRITNRVADRTGAVLALATGRADHLMEKAQVVAVTRQAHSCRRATAMARMQTKMARTQGRFDRFQATSEREQAALADFEANRASFETDLARLRVVSSSFTVPEIRIANTPVVCSRVRVNIPRPIVKIPVVHVRTAGAGPV
jgi:hypothetical protein